MRSSSFLPRRKQAVRGGFSLIELMVVVAIILLLAAILFPVFSQVRRSSQLVVCQSNLKQIGIAFQLYTSDYNGYYPSGVAHPANCSWTYNLVGYLKSTEVFTCPTSPNDFFRAGCPAPEGIDDVIYNYQGGYAVNYPNSRTTASFRQSTIRFPDKLVFAFDSHVGGFTWIGPENIPATSEHVTSIGLVARHNDGANVLYADGHTKWKSLDSLVERSQWTLSPNTN